MTGPNDGAFPDGMTLRQYAAVKAMTGLLRHAHDYSGTSDLARDAIRYADALIAELAK